MELNKNGKGEQAKRKAILDNLRTRGNFFQKVKALRVGGELIVWRRPTVHDVIDVTGYRPCPYCFVFVTKKEMWRHVKRCPANTGEDDGKSLKKSELLLFPNKY